MSQSCAWMERPLSQTLLAYAAADIVRIESLFNHFVDMNYIPSIVTPDGIPSTDSIQTFARLLEQSHKYVTRHRQFGRPDGKNVYISSEFLPLGMLSVPKGTPLSQCFASEVPELGETRKCNACLRTIDLSCFPYDSTTGIRNAIYAGDKNVSRTHRCRLCSFLAVREAEREKARVAKASRVSRFATSSNLVQDALFDEMLSQVLEEQLVLGRPVRMQKSTPSSSIKMDEQLRRALDVLSVPIRPVRMQKSTSSSSTTVQAQPMSRTSSQKSGEQKPVSKTAGYNSSQVRAEGFEHSEFRIGGISQAKCERE